MFTGIVEEIGIVKEATTHRLVINGTFGVQALPIGGSISVNGVCLTVVEADLEGFAGDLSEETTSRTNLGSLASGGTVNLERPLMVGQAMGGHIVQGHVDGTGVVESLESQGASHILKVGAPSQTMRYVVEKGFVAIDGTSFTIVWCDTSSFTVSVIPFTLRNTILRSRRSGELVNLEVDILAKYVEKLLSQGLT